MTTWNDMSKDSLKAAKRLLESDHHRSAASRACFAAYACAAGALDSSLRFAATKSNPSHSQLASLVRHNLSTKPFSDHARTKLARLIRNLQRSRVIADYAPGQSINRDVAFLSVRDAAQVLSRMQAI